MNIYLSDYLVKFFPTLSTRILGFPAWYWLSMAAAVVIAWALARILKGPITKVLASLFRQDAFDENLFVEKLRGPVRLLAMLVVFLSLSVFIRDPNQEDMYALTAIQIATFLWLIYLFYCLIDFGFTRFISKHTGPRSRVALILPLGRRVTKALLVLIAAMLLLARFGVDVSAFLVGLGVGGLAIALAAQKILENLFAGAVLSLDQPFQVGDRIKCSDISGTIEEMGFRSTRIRTLDRTLIIIPNSKLADNHIENFMEREKIRLNSIWRLDLMTSGEKVREVLVEFHKLLSLDESFNWDSYSVRLIGVSDLGIEIEILAFAKTVDFAEFAVAREKLFLSFIEKLEMLEVSYARPERNERTKK